MKKLKEFSYQEVLRHLRAYGEVENPDRRIGQCSRCHRHGARESQRLSIRLVTDLSLTQFQKMPIQQALAGEAPMQTRGENDNKLNLFAF